MKYNPHTRQGYEQLLRNICRETNEKFEFDFLHYSDHGLLKAINSRLQKNGCKPFAPEEMNDILEVME